jgi:hypothetical protein
MLPGSQRKVDNNIVTNRCRNMLGRGGMQCLD